MAGGDPGTETALRRLELLEGFLRSDASNLVLRSDAFGLALRSGQWDRAAAHLAAARHAAPGDAAWALRQGDLLLAQRRYDEARVHLEQLALLAEPGAQFASVVAYNLAFIDFRQGRFDDAVRRLEPRMQGAGDGHEQQLWLRALHQAGAVARACDWAQAHERTGQLTPEAAGIAALAAVDRGDFAVAQRWAHLAESAPTAESHVASATLALTQREPAAALHYADLALQLRPDDGRALSVRGFAGMLAGSFAEALADFQRALAAMPAHIGTWQGLGWTQLLQRDFPGAQASFERALALDRNFAESHGALACALAMQGRADAAKDHIALAQRLDKACAASRYAQSILTGEAQDAQAVQRLAQQLLSRRHVG